MMLSPEPDPAQRCQTAFFKVLSQFLTPLRGKNAPGSPGKRRLWANVPRQSAAECYTLAFLSLGLYFAFSYHLLADGAPPWSPRGGLALAGAPFLAVVWLHLLPLVLALAIEVIDLTGVIGVKRRQRFCVWLHELAYTVMAVYLLANGGVVEWLAAGPWFVWSVLNVGAWVLLLFQSLANEL